MLRADRKKYWEEQYEGYRASGLTCREFCKEREISYASLKSWITKIRREDKPKFIEMPAIKERGDLSVILPGGVEIKIPEGFSEASLRRILWVCGGLKC